MVTSEGNWLVGKKLLLGHGFEPVGRAAPSFELLVKRLDGSRPPRLPADWEARARRFGSGVTVVRSDQCPYLDDAVNAVTDTAREHGLGTRVVELRSAQEVRERAPSPFGAFSLLLDGRVISYHPLTRKKLAQLLADGVPHAGAGACPA